MMTPEIRQIIAAAASRWRVKPREILGPSRSWAIAAARQEAYWRAYQTGRYSLPQIGRAFGRHHTSVLHGIRVHEERLAAFKHHRGDNG